MKKRIDREVFMCALGARNRNTVETLVKKYPDAVRWKNHNGQTALHFAAADAAEPAGMNHIAYLLGHHADVNMADLHGYTPLHFAAQQNGDKGVKLLLDHGADINARNKQGETPLHHAVRSNDPACVAMLVLRGACIDLIDQHNHSALDDARHNRALYEAITNALAELTRLAKEKEREYNNREIDRICHEGLDEPVKVFAKPVIPIRKAIKNGTC